MKLSIDRNNLVLDIISGLTVSFAALSLGAAFGVMSGRGAFAGMIGAAVIPIIASIFGGTRIQASGPTAPMTAISALIVAYAYESFPDHTLAEQFITLVFLANAMMLIIAGILRLGQYISLVPNVIILGFMNGIGVLIWADQIKRLFGMAGKAQIQGAVMTNVVIALLTLAFVYLIPWAMTILGIPHRIKKFVPSMFIVIVVATVITTLLSVDVELVQLGSTVSSLSEFGNLIMSYFPSDATIFQTPYLLKALPFAIQLTLLAYLDSLLTSLVVDKMTSEKTNQNKELIAQGLANATSSILQGIPGAQATIRSVLLLKEGAQSRLAGVMVGVFALLGFLVFGKYIAMITSAVFVGVLFKAGLDVVDRDFIVAYFKNQWYNRKERNIQFLFVIYTTIVTVLVDLNIAVLSGTVLFFLAKKLLAIRDAEDTFEEVHGEAEDISG